MIFATTNEDIMDMKNQESKSEVCNSIKQINISTQVKLIIMLTIFTQPVSVCGIFLEYWFEV